MNDTSAKPIRRLFTPVFVLILAVLAGYCLLALQPAWRRRLGLIDEGMWFLDSYAILASSDARQAGLDPAQPNPLDVYHRPHSYSNWWFLLGKLGLSRQDNFLVGGSWVLVFLGLGLMVLRPRTFREAGVGGMVLLAPPVLLAVNRANNDLVVFILLAIGLLCLRDSRPWRLAVFAALLVLATGLKFYPIVAGAALLLVRPAGRRLKAVALTVLAGGVVLASVWADFQRAVILAPTEVYTFGAPIIFRDLGWTGRAPLLAGVALLGLAAWTCVRRGWLVRLDDAAGDFRERCAFVAGAALLVGCFLAGISYSYRLVFMIFLVPLLWRQISTPIGKGTGLLLLATLWLDGLYCLGANILIGPMPLPELVHYQLVWRFVTQPIVWAAMILLAGSLLGMQHATMQDTHKRTAE